MPLFASRKTRTAKAKELRPTSIVTEKLEQTLKNRGILARLLLCAFALVLMTAVVEGWRAPFPYRLGQRVNHGVTARADFKQIDRYETNRAAAEAAKKIPFIFTRDKTTVAVLSAKLRRHLSEIAEAEDVNNLSSEAKKAFKLELVEGANAEKSKKTIQQEFGTLQAAVSVGAGAGNQIEIICNDFQEFIKPLFLTGVADPQELTRNSIRKDSAVLISDDSKQKERALTASDILLSELLKDTGAIGKTWVDYPKLSAIRAQLKRWIISQTPHTLRYDKSLTQQKQKRAREQSKPVYDSFRQGEDLLPPGKVIDEELLTVLKAEHDAIEGQVSSVQQVARSATVLAMLTVLAILIGYHVVNNHPKLVQRFDQLALYLSVVVIVVLLGRMLSFDPMRAEALPLVAVVMIITIAYNQIFATLTCFSLCLIITLSTGGDLGRFVILMSASATAIMPLTRVPSRSTLIKVGFLSAMTYFAVTFGTGIIEGESIGTLRNDWSLLIEASKGAAGCLIAGYLVSGSLPLIESSFDVLTDSSLLEMSDVSHPLLQELVRRAPGTYNHSIAVATIGETAADAIGANGLLLRVGAYYHDIGKMLKPQYFIENQLAGTENLHNALAPAMSTLIIIGHVKDGVDLARQHHLPQSLVDFIEQHHGTTLVEYFFNEATKAAKDQPDHKTDAEESSFRYPGPKPQSREAGVMMLADAVESASRTLSDPTPKRIENLVRELTMKRLLDGQFEESSLTLSEIHSVEESLIKSLIGIYHGRVKYPEQQRA